MPLNRRQMVTGVARHDVLLHCANFFASLIIPANRPDRARVGRAAYGHGGPSFPELKFFGTSRSRVASTGPTPGARPSLASDPTSSSGNDALPTFQQAIRMVIAEYFPGRIAPRRLRRGLVYSYTANVRRSLVS